MQSYFWIGLGSALGGMARYWCSGMAAALLGETFPWGTLIVNEGEWASAGPIGASVALCLLAVWLGHIAAVQLNGLKWV